MKNKIGSSLRGCAKILNFGSDYKNRNKTISKSTIDNYIKTTEWGRIARKMTAKPLITEKNVKDRFNFALEVKSNGYCHPGRQGRELRENILWTDESPIQLNPIPNKQVTRIRSTDKTLAYYGVPKKSIHIMVSGGITAHGKTELYVCPPKEIIDGKVHETKILPIYLQSIDNKDIIKSKKGYFTTRFCTWA